MGGQHKCNVIVILHLWLKIKIPYFTRRGREEIYMAKTPCESVQFCGCDTNNIISTAVTGANPSYTATVDCWVKVEIQTTAVGSSAYAAIDGVPVVAISSPQAGVYQYGTYLLPLKKGQQVTTRNLTGATYSLTSYGLKL